VCALHASTQYDKSHVEKVLPVNIYLYNKQRLLLLLLLKLKLPVVTLRVHHITRGNTTRAKKYFPELFQFSWIILKLPTFLGFPGKWPPWTH